VGPIKGLKVVIDTNVVVSALLFGGVPGKLVSAWKHGDIHPFVSQDIIDEYMRVFAYPKFQLNPSEIEHLIYREILPFFEVVASKTGKKIVRKDPTDDKFIHCAIEGNIKVIISGDRHLLSLKQVDDIRILNPFQFLKLDWAGETIFTRH
jgi:putative PIN family toxin of toxin-antitoxin system